VRLGQIKSLYKEKHMTMTAEEARKIMGKKADKYTDEELLDVINTLTVLSDLAIDSYLKKRTDEKRKTNQ